MSLSCDVIKSLEGRTLVTAESCTGGGIGAALTAVPGSSAVFMGGVITYTNEVKNALLGIPVELLQKEGVVSEAVAWAMAVGARERLCADVAISVTGLAGPSGDEFGNPVGTVYIGFSDITHTAVEHHVFSGDRQQVRQQAVKASLRMILNELRRDSNENN